MIRPDFAVTLEVPAATLEKWQHLVNTVAELLDVPAALIMRVLPEDIEVLVSSQSKGNPFRAGRKERLFSSGLFCEHVVAKRRELLVADALADEEWRDNPGVKLGMISFLGVPIRMPSGAIFGTICVLDSKANEYNETYKRLLQDFRELVESHLALIEKNELLILRNAQLAAKLETEDEARAARLIACRSCRRVTVDGRKWLEAYLHLLENGILLRETNCPECRRDKPRRGGRQDSS